MPESKIPLDTWTTLGETRMMMMMGTYALIIKNGVPRQTMDGIREDLLAENASVRGNRDDESRPTWEDARYCFLATLKMCMAMLEEK